MKLFNIPHTIVAFALCIAISSTAYASKNTISNLQDDIKNHQDTKVTLSQDLEITEFKIKSAKKKLTHLQREIKFKELQLKKMQTTLGNSPTLEQKEFIANETKRVHLGAAAIKSRKAAIARLQRKAAGITKKIAVADDLSLKAKNKIASIQRNNEDAKKAANNAKAYRLRRQMEELKKENEQLRLAMAEEAKRARSANHEKKQLEEITRNKEIALKEAELRAKQKAQELEKAQKLAAINQDQSQIVLPGEKPIYKKSDGKKVIIRNRGKSKSSMMLRTGESTYRAEVELEPGKSYFDVKRRRYRGHFPKQDGKAIYVFTYDISDKKRPVLTVKRKEENPNQMISNANDAF